MWSLYLKKGINFFNIFGSENNKKDFHSPGFNKNNPLLKYLSGLVK